MKKSTIFFALAGAAALYYLVLGDEGDAVAGQQSGKKVDNKPGGVLPGTNTPGGGGGANIPGGANTPGGGGSNIPGGGPVTPSIDLDPQLKAILTTIPSARFSLVRDKLSRYFTVVKTPLIGNQSERVTFDLDKSAVTNASRGDVLCEAIQENDRHLFVPTTFGNTADEPMKITVIGLRDDAVDYNRVKQLADQGYSYVYLDPQGYSTVNP